MKILFPISLILTSILLFFFIVNPFFDDIKSLKTDISIYNNALDNSTSLQKERDLFLEKSRNVSAKDRERLNSFLPDTVNNIKFILEIEKIANINEMPLRNIKFEDKPKVEDKIQSSNNNMIVSNDILDYKPYGVFPVEFITEGNYGNFLNFLEDLERNLRLMDIKSVSFIVPDPISKSGNGFDPNIYSYKLNVETYWLK